MSHVVHSVPADPYARLPLGLYFVAGFAVLLGMLSPNPLLTVAALVSLVAFIKLLWRPGETPVLVFAVGFQWLQVTAKIFHANWLGMPIPYISEFASIEQAIWASLVGLWVLVIGIRIALSRLGPLNLDGVRAKAMRMSVARLALLYVVAAIISTTVGGIASQFPAIRQILLNVHALKWAAFFLFGYVALVKRDRQMWFVAAVAYEFVAGIGFFSGFKTPLFVSLLVYFTARVRISTGSLTVGAVLCGLLLVFGLAWTAVKGEYRAYVTGGQATQGVTISGDDAMAKLIDLVVALDLKDLSDAADPLFRRVAYVDFFAATMDYVPAVHPHENGAIWGASVRHVTQPRVLFPNKPRLPSDSELTMRYTGLYLASDAQGTSISIGYMGESYIDFGIPGMFIPVLLLGMLWGGMYLFFMRRPEYLIYGLAIATAVLKEAYQFEMVSIKLLGGVMMTFIVMAMVYRFVVPRLDGWLMATPVQRRAQPRAGLATTVR
jgi:hypothetical protein